MSEITVATNAIIFNSFNEQDLTISARELHEKLDVKTRFNDWFSRIVIDCQYSAENGDFVAITQKRVTAQGNEFVFNDYIISTTMAKEICMLSRSEVGKTIRMYFIEAEKKLRSVMQTPVYKLMQYSTNQLETAKAITAMLEIEEKKHQEELAIEHKLTKTVYSALNTVKQDYVGLYSTFVDTESWDDMREVAAKLHVVGMGRNKLFQLLRDKGILDNRNIPYRKFVDAGYFKLSDAVRTTKKGKMRFSKLMISKSGEVFIERLLRKS